MPEIQDPEEKLKRQKQLNHHKKYHDFAGWPVKTYEGIVELLELCPEKKKKQLLKYYGRCGTKAKLPQQVLTSGKVTTQNLFVRYRRRMKQQKIILGQTEDKFFPSQVTYKTLKGTF